MSEWSERVAQSMVGIQDELCKKYPEQIKKWEKAAKGYEWPTSELKITVSEDTKYTGRYAIRFKIGNDYATLIKFTLDCYPACCALHQLNDFFADEALVPESFLKDFIQVCLNAYSQSVSRPRRLMINFVEWTRQDVYNPSQKNIPIDEKTKIIFPMMYNWAKEFDNIETTFVNHNTARIIHNVIVNLE